MVAGGTHIRVVLGGLGGVATDLHQAESPGGEVHRGHEKVATGLHRPPLGWELLHLWVDTPVDAKEHLAQRTVP